MVIRRNFGWGHHIFDTVTIQRSLQDSKLLSCGLPVFKDAYFLTPHTIKMRGSIPSKAPWSTETTHLLKPHHKGGSPASRPWWGHIHLRHSCIGDAAQIQNFTRNPISQSKQRKTCRKINIIRGGALTLWRLFCSFVLIYLFTPFIHLVLWLPRELFALFSAVCCGCCLQSWLLLWLSP